MGDGTLDDGDEGGEGGAGSSPSVALPEGLSGVVSPGGAMNISLLRISMVIDWTGSNTTIIKAGMNTALIQAVSSTIISTVGTSTTICLAEGRGRPEARHGQAHPGSRQ